MNDPHHVYMEFDVIKNDYNSANKAKLKFEECRNTPSLPNESAGILLQYCSLQRSNGQHTACFYTSDSDGAKWHKQNNVSNKLHLSRENDSARTKFCTAWHMLRTPRKTQHPPNLPAPWVRKTRMDPITAFTAVSTVSTWSTMRSEQNGII